MMTARNSSYGFSKHFKLHDGYLYCEDVCIKSLQENLQQSLAQASPVFLFSKAAIIDNIEQYQNALSNETIAYKLGYSMKANFNPHILQIFQEKGLTAITVSGHEVLLALEMGFPPEK